jgi:arylsulfatase A-like enzyme
MKKLGFLLIIACYCQGLQAQNQPNVIIILADDQGWGDVGFNGGKDIPTPNLDALAASGIVFEAGYASHPYCSPSRAGLMTGRYQQRFGHENNTPYAHDDPEAGLPLDEMMLAEVMKDQGYGTCMIGKWHLGDFPKFWPNQRGYDYWYGFPDGGMSYWGDVKGSEKGILRNGVSVPKSEQTYLTDDFTNEAIAYIDRNQDKPFFMYLAYNAPHGPIHATREYLAKTDHIEEGQRSAYGAMVVGMDVGIGRIINKLKRDGLFDNTLIFFYSDNGAMTQGASSYPFRGHKGMLFEGGIRVPFLVSWPAQLQPGRYDQPISGLDIYPTVINAAGARHQGKKLDGIDLMPFLTQKSTERPHDQLYWRYSGGAGYAVRNGDWKMVMSGYKNDFLLFNLADDPYEQNDLSKENKAKLDELIALYKDWEKDLIAPKWSDPHAENVLKEESRRQKHRQAAAAGERKVRRTQ